jgi:hypothetical protein
MKVPCKNIPYYKQETKTWSKKSFDSQADFADFLLKRCFKEPGEYEFDICTLVWNQEGRNFIENGFYTSHSVGTSEYYDYWDFEKLKSRLGVFVESNKKIFYLTRDYYFLLNYCPIANKEADKDFSFMSVRDVQYHMMIYEKIAELKHMHSAILKKRQMAFTNCHAAKCLNFVWFENKKTIKILASDDTYLNASNGIWKMVNSFRNHINQHTDWVRTFNPGEYPDMVQVDKVQNKKTKEWTYHGNESSMSAKTLQKDATKAVGGAGFYYFHEEGGIAPKADQTLTYLDPAVTVTENYKSGSFCIGGSVGDLDDCKPLEDFIRNPGNWKILSVPTKWNDESGLVQNYGLFIPTQYGMPDAVDEWGNSLVDKGLEILDRMEKEWRKLPPEQYALKKSQNPKTIKEAFQWRKVSEFDIEKIERIQQIIKTKNQESSWDFKPIKCRLYKDDNGKVTYTTKGLSEELEYPIKETQEDKRGVVTIYKPPEPNAPFYTYFAGVDPVEVGASTTSKSVFSISIWKGPTEEEYIDDDGSVKIRIQGDEMVANWRGRFNNLDQTNDYAEMLIKLYNAYTLVERNKPNFINHMMRKNLTHYLAVQKDLPLMADGPANIGASQYGFHKGGNGKASEIFKQFKEKFKEYLDADYGSVYKTLKNGEVSETAVKTYRGYDRIPDLWFLEELKMYRDDNIDNFDRIISDFAGYYLMKLYSIKNGTRRIRAKSNEPKKATYGNIYNYISYSKENEENITDFTQY